MDRTLERVTRVIRAKSRPARTHRPRSGSWESEQWQNGLHRRDPWV